MQARRFAGLQGYVGGTTYDTAYPQRFTRMTFACSALHPSELFTSSNGFGHRDLDAFTMRYGWDPLGVWSRFNLLGL